MLEQLVAARPYSIQANQMGRLVSEVAIDTIRTERAGLDALEAALRTELGAEFERAVRLMQAGYRVVVSGMGKSGHVGRKIAATLASTGTTSTFVHPAEASHGDLGMIGPGDVVLALSWSGETIELSDIVAYTRRFSVPLIGITSSGESALAKAADVALVLPRALEACPNGLAPTTSTLMQMAMGDALAVALLSAKGFSATDFRRFHPGGKLGAQLKRVQDVMRPINGVPSVLVGATVGDALVRMCECGLGYALVLAGDRSLAGIVTDGDLRRNMSADLVGRPVAEIMTQTPKVFSPSLMAAEALAALNAKGITAAPVVDEKGVAVGGVHMIDFVKAGVF